MRIGLNIWSAISLTVCKTGALEVDLSETGWWVERTSGVVTLVAVIHQCPLRPLEFSGYSRVVDTC